LASQIGFRKQYRSGLVIYKKTFIMKIIDIHNHITNADLFNIINVKLNTMFREQRQEQINFITTDNGDNVEVSQPDLYEGFLFRIAIDGTHLNITRSEHYTDDVNSLTVESILAELFDDLSGDKQTSMVVEG
jgi:hypothetical protein